MSEHSEIPMNQGKRYPLLPYSQLVFDMMKTEPDVYWFNRKMKIAKNRVEIPKLKFSVELALRNHPVLSMTIDSDGIQHYKATDDIFHGQYHSVDFSEDGEYIYVDLRYNRILGDGRSIQIFFDDIFRAYKGKKLYKDEYINYLELTENNKCSQHYISSKRLLEKEFDDVTSDMLHPKTDVMLGTESQVIESELTEDYSECNEALVHILSSEMITKELFFLLCTALAMMQYNDIDKAALTWGYIGRETELEQRIFGSLHRDIPFIIRHENRPDLLFEQIRKQVASGIEHSDYPYTLTYPNTKKWNYAVNVLAQPSMKALMQRAPFEIEFIEEQMLQPNRAYSLLDIEIYDERQLTVIYRYNSTYYRRESIQRFADLVRQNALQLFSAYRIAVSF